MIRRPPRSTHCISSAASDVYKRQLQVENLIEGRHPAIPENLMDEIMRFVRPLSRKLHRVLSRNVTRDPVRVLDVLFDAQQLLRARQPMLAA